MIPVYSSNYFENFLDAIPSWSSYPCQCGSVGERVIVSDLEIAIASPSSEHICLFCSFDVRPLSQRPENPRWDFYDRGLHHFPIPLLSHHPDPESGFLTSWHRSSRDSDRFCQVTTEEEQELTISRCERIALGKNQWEPLQRVHLTKSCRIFKEFIVNYQILQCKYLSIYEGLWQDVGCGDGANLLQRCWRERGRRKRIFPLRAPSQFSKSPLSENLSFLPLKLDPRSLLLVLPLLLPLAHLFSYLWNKKLKFNWMSKKTRENWTNLKIYRPVQVNPSNKVEVRTVYFIL